MLLYLITCGNPDINLIIKINGPFLLIPMNIMANPLPIPTNITKYFKWTTFSNEKKKNAPNTLPMACIDDNIP